MYYMLQTSILNFVTIDVIFVTITSIELRYYLHIIIITDIIIVMVIIIQW